MSVSMPNLNEFTSDYNDKTIKLPITMDKFLSTCNFEIIENDNNIVLNSEEIKYTFVKNDEHNNSHY